MIAPIRLLSCSVRNEPAVFKLARMIHERFCCNRRSAAATSLRPAGSPFGPSTYCTSTHRGLRAPRAGLATRLRDFATNRHESYGLWSLRVMNRLVSADIEAYAQAHSMPESDLCRALRDETQRRMESPQMIVGPLEGAFLKMMAQLVQAKRVLEIGMFTGYSALCFAEALPADGTVITCEVDEESAALARQYFARSPIGKKIEVRMGPALDTMRHLNGPFDLIFIDADKINYVNYYRRALELVSPRGLILIDNVLWDGDVLKQPAPDEKTAAIQELNRVVATDPRVTAVLVTVRDGVLVIRPQS